MVNSSRKIDLAVATPDINKDMVPSSFTVKECNSHVLATVMFDGDEGMVVEGGKQGKKALENAKHYTSVCYVRDSERHVSVKLTLIDGQWER